MAITDTGAKPFKCKECSRSFGRQDSLLRHQRLHTRSQTHANLGAVRPDSPPTTPETGVLSPSTNGWGGIEGHASTGTSTVWPNAPLPELDFDLVWPDSEQLFEAIMASDTGSSQWQMPLGTLPITSHSQHPNSGPIGDRPPPIEAIPLGGNHQAVHGVSKMISSLVGQLLRIFRLTLTDSSVFEHHCGCRLNIDYLCLLG